MTIDEIVLSIHGMSANAASEAEAKACREAARRLAEIAEAAEYLPTATEVVRERIASLVEFSKPPGGAMPAETRQETRALLLAFVGLSAVQRAAS